MSKRAAVFFGLFILYAGAPAWSQEWAGPDNVLAAARNGNPEAQLEMGILYEYGFFMAGNKIPALAWYMLAAEQGQKKAAAYRDKLQQVLTPEEVEQAYQLKATLAVSPSASSSQPGASGEQPSPPPTEPAPAETPPAPPEVASH